MSQNTRERHPRHQAIDFYGLIGAVCHFIDKQFATSVFGLSLDCLSRQPLLVCRSRVTLNFRQRLVSGDRRDLARGTSRFGETPCCRLAQTMRLAALGQPSIADCRGHHVPEALDREGLAIRSHKYRCIITIADLKHTIQSIVNWNGELCCGFLLCDSDRIADDICPGHTVDVRPALSGVQEQCEAKTLA